MRPCLLALSIGLLAGRCRLFAHLRSWLAPTIPAQHRAALPGGSQRRLGAGRDHAQEAITELQQVLSSDADNMKAHSDLGFVFLMQRDYEHAEPHLEKAAGSGSNDAMVHFYYAMLMQKKFQSSESSP